ncbi:MAG: dTDP-4-dehydrorhamnose reductase [Planctomycetes bacterium]|nr:dTDP-4-dehydrorhamnose reductase [Planctomycetota bacterium]
MDRILITGGSGMLGRALVREWTGRAILFPVGPTQFDLRDAAAVGDAARRLSPQVIVHTAAYTNVDGAETDAEACTAVNDRGTAHVAVAAAASGARLVYVSTDYVFDGSKGAPYTEDDATHPLNVYGRTKLAGEAHARGVPGHLVVRTQGLFGREGKSFVRSILQAAIAGRAISVVDDVTTGVTYADDLAKAIRLLVESGATGTYHVANEGGVVWADFARAILDEAGRGDVPVARLPAAQTGRAARRPPFSVLDTRRYAATVGSPLPSWRDALRRHLKDPAIRAGG